MSEQPEAGAAADRLALEIRPDDLGPSLSVVGEIDVFTAPSLADRLLELCDSGSSRVVVELEGVTFIDSTGLRVLIEADRRMRDVDGSLVLLRPSRAVSRLLELTALGDWLTVEPEITPGAGS